MKKLKLIGGVLYWFIFCVLILIAALVGVSAMNIPGGIKFYTVQSGSMEPSIHMGSIVVSKPSDNYQKGDVVTVSLPSNPKVSLTHRILEVKEKDGKTIYVTKGDANDTPDTEERPKENVLGKVLFSVPLVGYPIGFAKTRNGLIILVIIPATLIIYSELISIKNETKKLLKERRKRKLSLAEKVEVEIGEEEIKAEKWYKKLLRKLHPVKNTKKKKTKK